MAFKTKREQEYYIIAKHSNLALGISSHLDGTVIDQQKFDPKAAHQKFQFHAGDSFCWIKLPTFDKYLAVGPGKVNEEPVITQVWNQGAMNRRFAVLPVADGYYAIKSTDNNRFFDILTGSSEPGKTLGTHPFKGVANQLFKLVPVADGKIPPSDKTLSQTNDIIRTGVLGAIGIIPYGGKGIAFIVNIFWKQNDNLAGLWDQMKSYVDMRIREFINAAKLEELRAHLSGIMAAIKKIEESPEKYKGGLITQELNHIVNIQQTFWTTDNFQVLPYMVNLGTVIITLNRMMYNDYDKLFKIDPDQSAAERKEIIEFNKRELKDAIKTYTDLVESAKSHLLDWRLKKIPGYKSVLLSRKPETEHVATEDIDSTTDKKEMLLQDFGPIPDIPSIETNYNEKAKDEFDGWSQEWKLKKVQSITGPDYYGDRDYKERAAFANEQRINQVREQFATEIDELVKPYRLWKYFDDDTEKTPDVHVEKSVGVFGGAYATNRFEGTKHKAVQKLHFYTENGDLCGLQVFYGEAGNLETAGLLGKQTGNEQILVLGAGEYINSVHGFAKNKIECLRMSTNKGNIVGGGKFDGRNPDIGSFCADLCDSLNAKLIRISGAHNGKNIEQLTFHWSYLDKVLTVG